VWWRAKKELGCCEPFDDVHRLSAEWAHRKDLRSLSLRRQGWWIGCTLEKAEAERQQRGSLTVGEEAEVTDADEASWQQVQQEATQKLIGWQAHESLLVAVGGVSPAEADLAFRESDQPAVRDADVFAQPGD
jgi:hypothetical protein